MIIGPPCLSTSQLIATSVMMRIRGQCPQCPEHSDSSSNKQRRIALGTDLENQNRHTEASSTMSPASSAYLERCMGLEHVQDSFSNGSSTRDLLKPTLNDRQTRSQELILRLVKAAVAFGVPSHRLKAITHSISHSMQCTANLYFLDNRAYLEFPAKTAGVPPALFPFSERSSMDFTKLSLLMGLLKKILRHPAQGSVDALLADLAQIEATPSAFSSVSIGISYVFSATTGAIMFFHGTWKDAAMSGVLAIIPASLMLLANEFGQLWWIYECISCFLVSLTAMALSKYFCYSTLILSAPITLLPGYTVSLSVIEIMTKNILAGSIRLCYSIVHLACMTLGLTLAPMLLNASWDGSGDGFQRKPVGGHTCAAEKTIAVNHFWLFLCVPLYIGAYNVYLKAPLRQWPLMTIVGCLGYSAGYASKHVWHAPPEVNAFAASFTIGLSANLYTLATDRFSFNSIVAGIFIQVPGSWGLRGLLAMSYAEYDDALYWCYSMLVICVSISFALLTSNFIVFGFGTSNRGTLHLDF